MVEIGFWTILILIFNTLVSFWNAYSTGYNSVALQKYNGKGVGFFRFANYAGLVISFAGLAYVLMFVIALIANSVGYIGPQILEFLLAFNQLVFGGLITFAGIIVAIESIVIAFIKKSITSVLLAVFNSFISIWNIFAYASSFQYAFETSKGFVENAKSDDAKIKAIIIIVAAVVTALLITYGFYKLGKKKASTQIGGVKVTPSIF